MKKFRTPETVNFNEMKVDKLVDYVINTHHSFIKEALNTFDVHLKTVVKIDMKNHPEIKPINILMFELKFLLEQHLNMEEHILFPYINGIIKNQKYNALLTEKLIENPIHKITKEHDEVEFLLKKIRNLSNNYRPPVDSSPSLKLCYAQLFDLEQDIHKHIFLEEKFLFPKMRELEKRNLNVN